MPESNTIQKIFQTLEIMKDWTLNPHTAEGVNIQTFADRLEEQLRQGVFEYIMNNPDHIDGIRMVADNLLRIINERKAIDQRFSSLPMDKPLYEGISADIKKIEKDRDKVHKTMVKAICSSYKFICCTYLPDRTDWADIERDVYSNWTFKPLVRNIEAIESNSPATIVNDKRKAIVDAIGDRQWLTIEEVCAKYNLPKSNVKDRQWRLKNKFPLGNDGPYGKISFHAKDVESWLEMNKK